jgi:oligogalacturonide transporter
MVVMYIFYLFMYCLFSTGFTIFLVPYNGLLPDMVEDYNMRSKFSSARMIWSTLGSATCGLVPAILITNNLNTASYSVCAYIFGFLFLVASMGTFIGTWERQREPVQTTLKESIPQSVSVFRNRSFRLFLGLHIFGQCAMDFVSGMAVYYIDDVLNGYVHGYLTYAMGTLLATQLIGMLVWGPIMTKTSKKAAILSGAPIRLMGTLGLLFVSYEGVPIGSTLIMFGLIGFGNAATLTGIYAIMADMADVDELITSVHRPGPVSGMATFVRKTSAGISAAMMGLLLSVVGYDEVVANAGGRQTAFTQQGISMIFILVPALLITCLIVTAVIFPITADEFAIIKKEVARRKGEDDSRATEEEIRVCEKVTGFSFEDLWKAENMTGRS